MSPLEAEPRSAETVHSGGELVPPGLAHSGARHDEPIRAGMEKASLHVTVLSFSSHSLELKGRPAADTNPKRTARMPFKSI